MKEYDPKEIEAKWQKEWEKGGLYLTPDQVDGKENEYILVEFAYPSGNLHVGHWYAFSVPDMYVRYRRMHGKNVMYPMGFDAFGLPAENAAIKNKLNPREWTFSNIDYMRKQLRSMGAAFDWSREVITASPEYYKWTQWLFLKFFEKGLAYQSETPVNWCPNDKTVLANEQVVAGKCERCGAEVEKRNMLQWNLRITDYADRLVKDLDSLDWPEAIKESQRNWIGRSEGAEIDFGVTSGETIKVFTTRPDTIFGSTYLVLAPEHEFISKNLDAFSNKEEVVRYIALTKNKSEIIRTADKTGVELKGIQAINPATKNPIPIWIADYVLPNYGTGAIMAVPAHDERDKEFALKFNLPVVENYQKADFDAFGTKTVKFKLRDWVVSRQRYWGVPIPVIHCEKCGVVPVPESDLPVVLPETDDYLPTGDGKSPLAKVEDWVKVKCPRCGNGAKRETDTLDTFVDSSWYYLRYTDPKNKKMFASREKMDKWLPIDLYSGGAEHTTMHLLYSRFWHKVMFDLGLVKDTEPYQRRMNRGLILGPDSQKMSKSRGNVIDPDKEVERLGADTVRMYLAFIGPYNEPGAYPWNPDGAIGVRRFLERVWKLKQKISDAAEADGYSMHQAIKRVTDGISQMKMNTAVSALMIYSNELDSKPGVSREEFETLIKLLAPQAPHIAEELWHELGNDGSIHVERWPELDESKLVKDVLTIAVQVNGKVRTSVQISSTADEDEVKNMALQSQEIAKWLEGKSVQKVIVVPQKIVNIVVK